MTVASLNERIFISRTGADAPAAQWIASTLTQQGYDCVIQDRDFQIGASFPAAMREAFESCDTVLAVMSPDYWKSRFCLDEWDVGYALDRGGQGRLIPVMVSPSQPPKLAAKLAYLDLARMPDGADKAGALVRAVDGVIKQKASLPHAMEPATIPLANDVFHTAHFTGREEELSALHSALWGETGAAALTPPATLTGLGGMGKSAIAREYARRHLHRYAGVWLIKSETDADRTEGFATLAIRLDPRLKDETNRPALAAHGAALAQRQAKLEGRPFLILLDNIEKPVDVPDYARGEGLHTIITTRWSAWTNDVKAVEIERLPLEAARALLLETSGRKAGEGLEDLLTALDGLPLGLVQAGAYLLENPSERFAEYAAALARRLSETPDSWPEDQKIAAATFWPSIDQAEDRAPGAVRLLANAAFYAPDDIPIAILVADPLAPEARKSIDALLRYSLARRGRESEHGASISVHRLLQSVVGEQLHKEAGEKIASVMENAASRIGVRIPRDQSPADFRAWPSISPLAPHLAALSIATPDWAATRSLVWGLNQAAGYYWSLADWSAAEPLFRRALAILQAKSEPNHQEIATAVNNLALLLKTSGRLDEAEPLYRDALRMKEIAFGPDHPSTATSLVNLAELLRHTSPDEAQSLCRRALMIDEAAYGPDHSEVAADLNNLAGLLQAAGRYVEAESMYQRALSIRKTNHGVDHPTVAQTLNNLASLLFDTGRMPEALPLLREAYAIVSLSLPEGHPERVAIEKLLPMYEYMMEAGIAGRVDLERLATSRKQRAADNAKYSDE